MRTAVSVLAGLALALASVAAADDAKSVFLDLQPLGNQSLTEDIAGVQGNNLKELPQGEQELAGSRFKIGPKIIMLRAEMKPDAPEKAEGIKVDAPFEKLHILHSTEFGEGQAEETDGTEVGAYVVHYADQTSERIPIVYGEDLRDWWDSMGKNEFKRAKVAWRGSNAASAQNNLKVRLFSVVWTNPHPDKAVSTIDFLSKNGKCAPFLVAMTVEKK